jgi:hypothetical protein
MGHEDICTTLNIYGHRYADDEDTLMQRLYQRAVRAFGVRDLLGVSVAEVMPLPTATAERRSARVFFDVDQRGIEPLTSPVRGVRSTN